ncbi:hypothetical protein D0B54_03560 [Solimonas sp. K1W22B-7]|uniref:LVIVD repeat-containing protein n=1 Tax=Solimonas sp. K1W22B-7 TaxID=2303331 RepID=UPI000E32DFA6|nr:hypothetical protein [Solimonas sp. K1W22B-7]AXQ27805.1 hypothetical protein D0B54_03560 [Solimonas sp. K1W22B-7]
MPRRNPLAFIPSLILAAGLAACGSSSAPSGTAGGGGSGSLPAADDAPETGMQGQVPLTDQLNGRSANGYRKGLKLVGQNTIMDRGANFGLAWIGDCAYVTTTSAAQLIGASSTSGLPLNSPLNGMAVIDAADPKNPKLVSILQSPAMLQPHESLQASESRKVIVATQSMGTILDVYDASDCRHPVLKATLQIAPQISVGGLNEGLTFRGHAMCLSRDGMTAYATTTIAYINNAAIDLSDLSNPKVVKRFGPAAHDCGVSPDGNRLYLAPFGPGGTPLLPNGMYILDSSDFQRRVAAPEFRTVGQINWTPFGEGQAVTSGSHTARLFRQGNRSYVFSSDEWPVDLPCPWGHGRIIDVTDETNPVKISDITLEVQQTGNCLSSQLDIANYSSHYVGFDDENNATVLFTTNYASGLRVWDIRDPANPHEIAYWMPKPVGGTALLSTGMQVALANGTRWDSVGTYVRYRPEKGHVWIAGYTSGFQILQFTESAGPTAPRPRGRR